MVQLSDATYAAVEDYLRETRAAKSAEQTFEPITKQDKPRSRPSTAGQRPASAASIRPQPAAGSASVGGRAPGSAAVMAPARPMSAGGRSSKGSFRPKPANGGSAAGSAVGMDVGGRISQQGMRSLSRSMLVEGMNSSAMAGPRKSKSARWISDKDKDILGFYVGTFEKAAESKWQPSATHGTGERFIPSKRAVSSHFLSECGPPDGPYYDLAGAFERGTMARVAGPVYRPPVVHSGHERLPLDKSEAADRIYDYTDTFSKAAADRHHGQGSRSLKTGGYGSSARFLTIAGATGEGHRSYIPSCQTVGVQQQNIRDWPVKLNQVRSMPYMTTGVGRIRHVPGRGGYGGHGADAQYVLPSPCFEYASIVQSGVPTAVNGTRASLMGYRYD